MFHIITLYSTFWSSSHSFYKEIHFQCQQELTQDCFSSPPLIRSDFRCIKIVNTKLSPSLEATSPVMVFVHCSRDGLIRGGLLY